MRHAVWEKTYYIIHLSHYLFFLEPVFLSLARVFFRDKISRRVAILGITCGCLFLGGVFAFLFISCLFLAPPLLSFPTQRSEPRRRHRGGACSNPPFVASCFLIFRCMARRLARRLCLVGCCALLLMSDA